MLEKCFAFFERIWYPFEWPGVSLQKKLSSIRTAWAINLEKIVVRLNSVGYPSQKNVIRLNGLGCPFGKKLSSLRTAWDIRFKKLLSVRTARAIRLKKKLLTIGGTEPICSKILAKFPSQNHFISTHSCRTICYSPGLVCYEVCLQTYHEYLWVSAPL